MKAITNVVFEGIDSKDYPDFSDAFIVSAECDGKEMSEAEIEKLDITDFYEEIIESLL